MMILRQRFITRVYYPLMGRRSFSTSNGTTNTAVAFLGLGNMGLPMAVNVAKSKQVVAFDLNLETMRRAQDQGIEVVDSIEKAIDNVGTIVTVLPSVAAVHAVMQTILESSVTKGTTIIDCSTVDPATSRHWHKIMNDEGNSFFDAPVSGGVKGAENGTLTFMVGCADDKKKEMKEHIEPLLSCMGQRIVACGGPGAGSAVKLCNNLAVAAQMCGVCEAMNLGEALGVDPVILASVMNSSTGKSWSCDAVNPHPAVAATNGGPASNGYAGGFGTALMLKDVSLAVSAGTNANVALPIGSAARDLFQQVSDSGLGGKDFGVLLQYLRTTK